MGSTKAAPAPWIDKEIICTALKKLKKAGVPGILTEMLKTSRQAGLKLFTELFNNVTKEKAVR